MAEGKVIATILGIVLVWTLEASCGGRVLVPDCGPVAIYCPDLEVCCPGGDVCAVDSTTCGGAQCCPPFTYVPPRDGGSR